MGKAAGAIILDYRYPDEIDPSEVEGIAEACDDATVYIADRGGYDWAGKLASAAKLLRLLAEASDPTPGGECDGSR